jgi:hypothetical protein
MPISSLGNKVEYSLELQEIGSKYSAIFGSYRVESISSTRKVTLEEWRFWNTTMQICLKTDCAHRIVESEARSPVSVEGWRQKQSRLILVNIFTQLMVPVAVRVP